MHQLECIRNCWAQMWFLLAVRVQIWYCSEKAFFIKIKKKKRKKLTKCLTTKRKKNHSHLPKFLIILDTEIWVFCGERHQKL